METVTSTTTAEAQPAKITGADGKRRFELAEIDHSCRIPVIALFGTAIFWLIIGTLLGIVASIKLHSPDFTINQAWETFGRIRPLHLNLVAYGWAAPAGLGVAIWLMARLCRTTLKYPLLLTCAGVLWNLGLILGSISVLIGNTTGIEWLEFPGHVSFLFFAAFALVGIWSVLMFVNRAPGHVYVSQWYLLAALFWFPWLYGTANLMLVWAPVQGSVQAVINWWYGHNALGLYFTPIGLAAAYYLIPKVIGKPVHSYYLSVLGFWSLALFYSWNGMHHLIGGPIPAWMVSASTVASIMMVIPVVTTAINHHMTMRGRFDLLNFSPTLRFTVFGAMAYTLASLQGSSMALRSLNSVTHFTHYTIGHAHLGLYAFFTMIMFGAIYYIMPRLTGWEWHSSLMIKIHFWATAIGITVMILVLTVGGLIQGVALNTVYSDGGLITMSEITDTTMPFLWLRSISGIAILVGHLAFAFLFVAMLLKLGEKHAGPTLFRKMEPATS